LSLETNAMTMREVGDPDVLEMRTLSLAWPGADDHVLVRLKAASLNPADIEFRSITPFVGDGRGCVLGHDGAGIVEEIGPGVTKFKPGDAVCFCNGGIGADPGTYAQHAVVSEGVLVAKPDSISFEQAAALPLVFITLWESLHDRAQLKAGEHVLIHAGAGGTGHIGVQIAKLLGGRVAATVSTPEKAAYVESLGAEKSILYRDEDFVQAALDWTDGRGLDVALDNVGAEVMQQTFRAMTSYGRVVTLMGTPSDTDDLTAYISNLSVLNVMMLTPMWRGLTAYMEAQAGMVAKGIDWLAEGKLSVEINRSFPLEQAADAHRLLEAGGITGKIVLTMAD
jgi:NADPH:quinone reductase